MDKQSIYHQENYTQKYDKDEFGGLFGHFLYDLVLNAF